MVIEQQLLSSEQHYKIIIGGLVTYCPSSQLSEDIKKQIQLMNDLDQIYESDDSSYVETSQSETSQSETSASDSEMTEQGL